MLNMIVAILVEKGVIPESEAEPLIDKVKFAMLPGDYPSAHALAKKFLNEIEKEKLLDE